jgi:hypothetical protein
MMLRPSYCLFRFPVVFAAKLLAELHLEALANTTLKVCLLLLPFFRICSQAAC